MVRAASTALSVSLHLLAMSGTGNRENVFATRMSLATTKQRLKGAQTGHSLLAKKRDALTTRFRAILRKVDEVSLTPGMAISILCALGSCSTTQQT